MLETYQIIILGVGVLLGFFAQTLVGFAAALVAFPFLLTVYNLQQATAFLSLYYIIFSILLIIKNRKDIDLKIVKTLVPGATIGLLFGIFILKTVNPYFLEKGLGIFIILYVLNEFFSKKRFRVPESLGWLFGLFGGLISGIVSSGGQVFVLYIDSRASSASVVRATVIAVLTIGNILRLPLMVYTHLLTKQIFYYQLLILPIFLLALFLGQKMYQKLNEKILRFLLFSFLTVSALIILLK